MDEPEAEETPRCTRCGAALSRGFELECVPCGLVYVATCSQHDPPYALVPLPRTFTAT